MINPLDIRSVVVTRYVTPLREGGSLPAIAEADDEFLYVVKFSGSGQGTKALVADFIGGELARTLGLKMPEMVFAELDPCFGRSEGDEEIQDLLKASTGLNLGVHYLNGAIMYDPSVLKPEPLLAAKILWLDALIFNVDRTAKNTNMLNWRKEIWLIDHGASLYFHHNLAGWRDYIAKPFAQVKDHIFRWHAGKLKDVDAECRALLTDEKIDNIINSIPGEWLQYRGADLEENEIRNIYSEFLKTRIAGTEKLIPDEQ